MDWRTFTVWFTVAQALATLAGAYAYDLYATRETRVAESYARTKYIQMAEAFRIPLCPASINVGK